MTLTEIRAEQITPTNFKKLITLLESDLNKIKIRRNREEKYIIILTDVQCETISGSIIEHFMFNCTLEVQSTSVKKYEHMKEYKKLRTRLLAILDS